MKREKRFRAILALLDENNRVTVEELAGHFNVSLETIRCDLSTMSEHGLLRKVYGGAVKFQSAQENTFALRTLQYIEQKTAIARYAIRFVQSGAFQLSMCKVELRGFANSIIKGIPSGINRVFSNGETGYS
jgi:DeoR/GlpR family transcriptional regulator of sugar metabolism